MAGTNKHTGKKAADTADTNDDEVKVTYVQGDKPSDAGAENRERMRKDRKAARDAFKTMGADMIDNAKDFTGKAADAASKFTHDAAEQSAKVASAFNGKAGKAAEAAGKVATDAADVAGSAAKDAAQGAADVADKVSDAASKAADKADAAAEKATQDLLKKTREQADEWQNRFLRLHAEWDTYRRRTEEQRAEERVRASEKLVSDLVPVLDDFERSINYAVKNGEGDLLDGVQAVHTKLVDVLTRSGVEVIDPKGQAFDALESQAVGTVDDATQPDETVNDVYQKGYRMGKKIIRPAMVTVTSGGPKRVKVEDDDTESDDDSDTAPDPSATKSK
ncbi:MAG: nucleotide exchange factor GrpE [Eggerthellaceae bacterium]|jgi:molecular chaperone GrpE|nr:nucleotide exchange factor GrpE [Eggerthellaceae bacterium]